MRLPVRLPAVLLFLASLSVSAADPPRKSPEDLVRDLSDSDFHTREDATPALWKLGEKARPALEQAVRGDSPEAAERAEGILAKFDWGIAPDTPNEVLAQIKKFRGGDAAGRDAALLKLADGGPANHRVLHLLLSKEVPDPPQSPPGSARELMFARFGKEITTRVPVLLFDGKTAEAEGLLELNLLGPSEPHLRDYVLFMAARGKATAAVERLAALRKQFPDNPGVGVALVYAHHAAGEGEKAKRLMKELAAADASLDERFDNLLVEMNQWGELIDRPAKSPNTAEGLKAFRLNLAGKAAEADAILNDILAADTSFTRGFSVEERAIGLFVNGRTTDGLARLKAAESAPHVAADIHLARLEFAAALDLITAGLAEDNGTVADGDDARTRTTMFTLYKLKRARLLAQLGERDAAAQLLTGLDDIADRTDRGVQMELVRTAVRCGFPDIAAGLLGKIQARREETDSRPAGTLYDPYEAVFEADADAARFWWRVVRSAEPKGNPSDQMRTVRELLAGKLKGEEVARWVKAVGDFAAKGEQADHAAAADPVRMALALAAAHRANGDTAQAVRVLEAFADRGEHVRAESTRGWVFGLDETFRLWVDLGDWLGEQGRHADAAKRLEQGWRLHPNNAVLLYLTGKALVAAGNAKEGKRRMELAHVVPLGNPQLRWRFLEELITRDERADMRTEMARVGECAWGVDANTSGNVWNQVGRAGVVLKDFAAAAAAQRKSMHFVLKTSGIVYVEGYAYANVPSLVRGMDARRLVAAGDVKAGLAAADDALAMVPTHAETLHGLVTMLDTRGETAAADRLFSSAWDRYAAAIKANPKSGWLKYQAAWLAVGCRREKELALRYATAATEDDPDHHGYREALAEAHFRNGDRVQATAVMAKLAGEDRRNWHYKRQLERYKSAAFDAPLPLHAE